jgi:hypothetical protein
VYHVALIETDWLFAEILEQPVPDEFAAWLPVDDRDGAGMLTVVRDQPLTTTWPGWRLCAVSCSSD